MASKLLLALLGAVALHHTSACIYKFGSSPDSVAPHSGTPWDYKTLGDDWEGTDATGKPWVCLTGTTQSPINIPKSAVAGDTSLRTSWNYPALVSDGSNVQVVNNGHVIQVQWTYNYTGQANIIAVDDDAAMITDILKESNAAEDTKTVVGKPAQFHFHTGSEHMVFGKDYPLELHIVHFVDPSQMPAYTGNGAISVTGILFEIRDDEDNPHLETILSHIPLHEGYTNNVTAGGVIDLGALLPSSGSRSYYQYQGSLTTPPCSEGLLWHVFEEPSYMSMKQYRRIMTAVNDKYCESKDNQTDKTLNPRVSYTDTYPGRRRLSSAQANRKLKAAPVHLSFDEAHKSLPHYVEMSAVEVPRLQRSSEGMLQMQSVPHRQLLAEAGAENMVCVVYAYSRNLRMQQPINGRIIKFFGDMPAKKMYECSKSKGGELMQMTGTRISSTTVMANGWAKDDHPKNQDACKKMCDDKKNCEAFTYLTSRRCILLKNAGDWVAAADNVYDSCEAVDMD